MTATSSATAAPRSPRRPLAALDHLIAQVEAAEARWLTNAAEAADGAGRSAALARFSDERLTLLRTSRVSVPAGDGRRGAALDGEVLPIVDEFSA